MTFKSSFNAGLGAPDLYKICDTAEYPLGTIVKGFDDSLGEGEFIFLGGVAAVVAGDLVVYDLLPGTPTAVRTLSGTHLNTGYPVAWAMAAIVAAKFGWFQISGSVIANGIAAGAIGKCFLTATAGCVDDTAINGCQVLNARLSSAIDTPSAGKVYVTARRPFVQGQTV